MAQTSSWSAKRSTARARSRAIRWAASRSERWVLTPLARRRTRWAPLVLAVASRGGKRRDLSTHQALRADDSLNGSGERLVRPSIADQRIERLEVEVERALMDRSEV